MMCGVALMEVVCIVCPISHNLLYFLTFSQEEAFWRAQMRKPFWLTRGGWIEGLVGAILNAAS